MASANILIVEDEAILAANMKMSLVEMGYSVAGIAPSGDKAIELAEEKDPNIIFMDIKIKGSIDGIETAKILYSKLSKRVIFITAHVDEATEQKASECNPMAFIAKPVEDYQYREIIDSALSQL